MKRFFFLVFFLIYVACRMIGQTDVWLVTVGPGKDIYELEGHAALRLQSPQNDCVVNFGLFDFNSPNFVWRFVKGETDYRAGAYDWRIFVDDYQRDNRSVVAFKLNLDSIQVERLIDLLSENLLPQNAVYRYNYLYDNCATRPLRVVEKASMDTLSLNFPKDMPRLGSFRNYMRYYHQDYPWYQFGIDLALGTGIDKEIEAREASFAPVILEMQIEDATFVNSGKKLVTEKVIINEPYESKETENRATPLWLTPLFIFWVIGIALCSYAIISVFKYGRWPILCGSLWYLVLGLCGLIIAFLVFVSEHEATSPNYNLLWLNPLCLVACVCVWIKKAKMVCISYFLLNFVLIIVTLFKWFLNEQSPNPAFVPLIMTDMVLSLLYLIKNAKCEILNIKKLR